MEALLPALANAAPEFGVGFILLALLGLLLRRETQDRADHRASLAEVTKRHADEMARVNAAHDAELAELRREITGLRAQVEELNAKLDAERERRRAAEDGYPPRPQEDLWRR